jgi:hypothetical protein
MGKGARLAWRGAVGRRFQPIRGYFKPSRRILSTELVRSPGTTDKLSKQPGRSLAGIGDLAD